MGLVKYWSRFADNADASAEAAASIKKTADERIKREADRSFLNSLIASTYKCPESISRYGIFCGTVSFYLFANLMLVGTATDSSSDTATLFQIVTASAAVHMAAASVLCVVIWHLGDCAYSLPLLIQNVMLEAGRLRLKELGISGSNLTAEIREQVEYDISESIIDSFLGPITLPAILNPWMNVFLGQRWHFQVRRFLGTGRAMILIFGFAAGIGIVLAYPAVAGCRAGLHPDFLSAPGQERAVGACELPRIGSSDRAHEGGINQATRRPRPFDLVAIRFIGGLGIVVFFVGLLATNRIASNLAKFLSWWRRQQGNYREDEGEGPPVVDLERGGTFWLKPPGLRTWWVLRALYPLAVYPLTVGLLFWFTYEKVLHSDIDYYRQGPDLVLAFKAGWTALRQFFGH